MEFPFPEGEPSGQFQLGSAERLKLTLTTTGNRVTRKSSMIFVGWNFSVETNLALAKHSEAARLPPGVLTSRPAALGHLLLGSFAVALHLLLLPPKTVSKSSLKGSLWERFLYLSFWEASKKYLTPF